MVSFKIKLKRTRAKDSSKNVRLYINGIKTKYFAKGGGYDKDLDVFCQFIKDCFEDVDNQFAKLDRNRDYITMFFNSIDAEFETLKKDKKEELYFIAVNNKYLKKGIRNDFM